MTRLERFHATKLGKLLLKIDDHPNAVPIFGSSVVVLGLVYFGWYAYSAGGGDALRRFVLTGLVGFLVGFFSLVFFRKFSGWTQLVMWIVVPGLALVASSLKQSIVAWAFGAMLGLGLGGYSAAKRINLKREREGLSGPVLLRWSGRGLSRSIEVTKLNLTVFREMLPQLDGDKISTFGLAKKGKYLGFCGDAAGRLVVYFTADPQDDNAWRRLSDPDAVDPRRDITVPMGDVEGYYLFGSTVDVDLARKAGEYFIQVSDMNPSLIWESGDDVFARRPPVLLMDGR